MIARKFNRVLVNLKRSSWNSYLLGITLNIEKFLDSCLLGNHSRYQ